MSGAETPPSPLPRHGGRIDLDERVMREDSVSYRAQLATPTGVARTIVRVRLADGDIAFDLSPTDIAPAWLLTLTRNILRGLWKDRNGSATPAWPERITRWREAKPGPSVLATPYGLYDRCWRDRATA